jgi:hypothetical protein
VCGSAWGWDRPPRAGASQPGEDAVQHAVGTVDELQLRRRATGATSRCRRRRERTGEWIEILIYIGGGFFLVAAAVIVLADEGCQPHAAGSLILLVFVLVEVLHTARFVVTRRRLQGEPFLIVALIAGVRRVLVLTAGTEPLARHDALVELGLLIALLAAASGALFLLRSRVG